MNIKTKPHLRTIILFIALGVIGLITSIFSLFIKEQVVKICILVVGLSFFIASIIKLFIEYNKYLELNEEEQLIKYHSLFKKIDFNIKDVLKIEKTIGEYIFHLSNNLQISVDCDLVELDKIIDFCVLNNIVIENNL